MQTTTVLAATLTIVFQGLIAFVGPDSGGEKNKTHAVLVDAQHHTPTMTFTEKGDANPTEIDLKSGDRITFSLGSGTAKTDTIFDTLVPTLTDYIQRGKFEPKVKNKEPHSAVLAYVDLPDGDLTAGGHLQHAARFTKTDGSTEIRCPARFVRFTKSTSDRVTFTIEGTPPRRPLTRTIDPTKDVEIFNGTRHNGNHYNQFERLLEFGGKLGFVSEVTNQDCTGDGRLMTVRETYEARKEAELLAREHKLRDTRLPNGDCGPTDVP